MKKMGQYKYSVYEYFPDAHRIKNCGYAYSIYLNQNHLLDSEECFETAAKAEFAAVGHITLLESGGR